MNGSSIGCHWSSPRSYRSVCRPTERKTADPTPTARRRSAHDRPLADRGRTCGARNGTQASRQAPGTRRRRLPPVQRHALRIGRRRCPAFDLTLHATGLGEARSWRLPRRLRSRDDPSPPRHGPGRERGVRQYSPGLRPIWAWLPSDSDTGRPCRPIEVSIAAGHGRPVAERLCVRLSQHRHLLLRARTVAA